MGKADLSTVEQLLMSRCRPATGRCLIDMVEIQIIGSLKIEYKTMRSEDETRSRIER